MKSRIPHSEPAELPDHVLSEFAAVEPTIWDIKFNNLTFREKTELFIIKTLDLILLAVMYVFSPLQFLTYLIVAGLVTIFFVVTHSWIFRIFRTEIRLQEGKIFQFLAGRCFSTPRQFDLRKYEIVISNVRMGRNTGIQWISVLLSGRNGSVEIARFGSDAMLKEGGKLDHPEAKSLRSRLASQLEIGRAHV